jgi:aminoglycoside phosphotransferase (APT) family kinase protein
VALTSEQLAAIVTRALPGERLREWRALADDRYALALADGERLNVQVYATQEAATTAAEALRLLRGEIDLPVPELRASDPEGITVGVPYLLTGDLPGEPLDSAAGRIGEEALYRLGRRLGETVQRVHRLAGPRYGSLTEASGDAPADERGYALARLEADVRRCGDLGVLDRKTGAEIAGWFEQHFKPAGRKPALVHGGLGPRTVVVRYAAGAWAIGGLLGWGDALGWSPAWDHVVFLDAAGDARLFGLRVGYGNGYDDLTERTYEQVREHALMPYRALLMLRRLGDAAARGDVAEAARRRGALRGLLRVLEQ